MMKRRTPTTSPDAARGEKNNHEPHNTDAPRTYPHQRQSFGEFLWNKDEGTVLGRTAGSWGKIGLFYVLFYLFLAGYFSFMMVIFYHTLDTSPSGDPSYTPGHGSLLRNPGLDIRPRSVNPEAKFPYISYHQDHPNSSEHLRESMQNFGKDYKCDFHDCPYNLGTHCSSMNSWGYNSNSPCVFLKIGKLLKWTPQPYEKLPADAPAGLQSYVTNRIIAEYVWVWCEAPGITFDYFPIAGFPVTAFPFVNTASYLPPVVALKLNNLPVDEDVRVECSLWADKLRREPRVQLGHKTFIVHVQSK